MPDPDFIVVNRGALRYQIVLLAGMIIGLVAVMGTAYLYTGAIAGPVFVDAVPVGLLVTALLVVNNLRDIATDRATGKRTLAVLIGERATRVEYTLLVFGAYLVPLGRRLSGSASAWFWLPWLSLPLAVTLVNLVLRREGRALNRGLRDTARLHLLFGLLFAASLLG